MRAAMHHPQRVIYTLEISEQPLLRGLTPDPRGETSTCVLRTLTGNASATPSPRSMTLRKLGINWDGDIVVQSERLDRYQSAIDALQEHDLVFECFCSRRDIREAASAAHAPPGHYPGTCLRLSERGP